TANKKKAEWLNNSRRIFVFLLPCNSFTLIPVIYDIYAGKIGKTHGDRNDNSPAPIAINIPTINIVSTSIPPIPIPHFVDISISHKYFLPSYISAYTIHLHCKSLIQMRLSLATF